MLAKKFVAFFLMLIMVVAPVAVVSAVEMPVAETRKSSFVPRLTAPSKSNKYYYSDLNKYERFGYGMPNCTAYAWGRAYEILGYEPDLSLNDADTWWDYNKDNKSYPYGQKPKLGAIACWNYTTGGGHVAVVEKIEDGEITFSNSAYGGKTFYLTYADVGASNGGIDYYTWDFQGYIYVTEGQSKEDYYQSLGGDVYKIDSYDGVNLRKGAGTSYSTLTAIPDKTQIVVKDIKKADGYTWGKTSYDGYTGWCVLEFAELVYKHQTPTAPPVTVPTEPPATEPEVTVPPTTEPSEALPPIFGSVTTKPSEPSESTADEPSESTMDEPTEATKDEITAATEDEPSDPSTDDEEELEFLIGDANGDGRISIADATIIQKYLAKIGSMSEEKLKIADISGDGRISVADATIIQKRLAGLIKSYILI